MRRALTGFWMLVLCAGAQDLVRAVQVRGLGWPADRALGLLSLVQPVVDLSVTLGGWYAVFVFFGLYALTWMAWYEGRLWLYLAYWVAAWFLLEEGCLVVQTLTGPWFGRPAPTGLLQLLLPRLDLPTAASVAVALPLGVAVFYRVRYERRFRRRLGVPPR